jgi:hypothetical protein
MYVHFGAKIVPKNPENSGGPRRTAEDRGGSERAPKENERNYELMDVR